MGDGSIYCDPCALRDHFISEAQRPAALARGHDGANGPRSVANFPPPPPSLIPAISITPPPAITSPDTREPPLLAAGDAKTLWIVHPISDNPPSFKLLARASDSGLWSQAQGDRGGAGTFSGFPRGLATVAKSPETSSITELQAAPAYVFTDQFITRFTLADHALLNHPLPGDQTLLAEVGGAGEMLALTMGPKPSPLSAATGPADEGAGVPPPSAIDIPAVENVPDTQPALPPATIAASQPQAPSTVNPWLYRNDEWTALPPLSESAADSPHPPAAITLALNAGRLIAVWVNPAEPDLLLARSLDYTKKDATWSAMVVTQLRSPLPPDARLLSLKLDNSIYVFWPVIAKTISLRGGSLVASPGSRADLTLPAKNLLPPLNLGNAVPRQSPADVVVGAAENSIAVVVAGENGALECRLFSDRGLALGPLTRVEPKAAPHDAQIVQNIAMLLLVLMLALSFWQWRQRPTTLKLPDSMVPAPLPLRAFAFLIDIGIPFILVSGFLGIGDFGAMFSAWTDSFSNPDELLNAPALLYTLVFYLLHVTIGELFFRRSIGKALLGLQVLMIDGKSPTIAAIFLRNLVRIPELLPGVLIVYLLVSATRQRLGDVLARTLVVANKAPETLADPEEKADKNIAPAPKKERLK